MARYPAPITETIGFEIYQRWVKYCQDNAVVPDPFVFWQRILVARDKYPISRGGFQHWLNRLQIPPRNADPYVWRDKDTFAWRLRDLEIREKE